MKRLLIFAIAAGLAATTFSSDADAQQRRRRRASANQMNAGPGDSTYYYKGRGGRGGTPMNEATTGVLGRDTVKMNRKGQQRNINQNKGLPLPPNNGKVGGL